MSYQQQQQQSPSFGSYQIRTPQGYMMTAQGPPPTTTMGYYPRGQYYQAQQAVRFTGPMMQQQQYQQQQTAQPQMYQAQRPGGYPGGAYAPQMRPQVAHPLMTQYHPSVPTSMMMGGGQIPTSQSLVEETAVAKLDEGDKECQYDPIVSVKKLILNDLKMALTALTGTASEAVRCEVRHQHRVRRSEGASVAMPDTPASAGTTTGTGDRGTGGSQEVCQERTSVQEYRDRIQQQMENFYTVCDKIESQFVYMREAYLLNRLFDSSIQRPLTTITSAHTQGALSLDQYIDILDHQKSVAQSLSHIFNDFTQEKISDQEKSNSANSEQKQQMET